MPDRGLRVMVAVPTHDMTPALFAYDLAGMLAFTCSNFVGPEKPIESIGLVFQTNTYIHKARQVLAEEAQRRGADCVLWLDSDMRFPKETLMVLLQHNRDIVGVNYSKRGIPPKFVAAKQISPAKQLVTDEDSEGLEEVEALGFGVVLMRTNVLMALDPPARTGHPWFWHEYVPGEDGEESLHVGEDVFFCRMAREAGFSIHVDHDLSKACAHIGTLEFTTEHALDAMHLTDDVELVEA